MIIPVSLEFENSGSYRKCGPIPLEDQGVVFAKGENLDAGEVSNDAGKGTIYGPDPDDSSGEFVGEPTTTNKSNGSGKSTPWGVLNHIIYGVTDKGLKKNQILTLLPDADGYFGQFKFKKDGKLYMVRQARGHSKYGTGVFIFERDQADKQWINITPKLSKDAQDFVSDQLVGLSLHEWQGCVFLSHGMAHILIEGTGQERKNYLSALFQLDRYDRLGDAVKNALDEMASRLMFLEGIETKATDIKNRIAELPARTLLEDRVEANKLADKLGSEKLNNAKVEIEKCKLILQDIERRDELVAQIVKLGYTESDRDDVLTKQQEHKDKYKELTAERDSATVTIGQLDQRLAIQAEIDQVPVNVKEVNADELAELTKEYQQSQGQLLSLVNQLKRKSELDGKLEALSAYSNLDEIQTEHDGLKSRLAVIAADIRTSKEELDLFNSLSGKQECPTCRSEIDTKTLGRLIDGVSSKLTKLKGERLESNDKLEKLQPKLEKAQEYDGIRRQLKGLPDQKLEDVQAELQKVKQDLADTVELGKQVTNYKALKKRLANLPNPEFDKPTLEKQLKIVNKQIEKLDEERAKVKEVAVLFKQLDGIAFQSKRTTHAKLDLAEEAYGNLSEAIKQISAELSTAQNQLDLMKRYEDDLTDTNAGLAELPVLRARQRRLVLLKKAFPILKTKHIHSITLAIKEILPRYVSMMFSEKGLSFTVDESTDSIDIFARRTPVKENGEAVPILLPVKALSNGEKKRLSVSFLFTLHDLLSPTKLIDLLILDEVDGGLDDDGLESLMSLIEDKKTKYGTIVMISHRQTIASARFDKVWVARKQNHESKLITNSAEAA